MTIITSSSDNPDPIKQREPLPSEPKIAYISPSGEKEPALDVTKPIASVVRTKKSKYITNEIPKFDETNMLIKKISMTGAFEKQNLKETLAIIDPGNHSMIYDDYIIYVSKIDNKTFVFGVANVAVKAFAKGGFGKVYSVDSINSNEPLVLKLSRKKWKSKNTLGQLISLTSDEKKVLEAMGGSSRGKMAKEELQREYQLMKFIKDNAKSDGGLNSHAYALVSYKNQYGLFIKKFDFDGTKLASYNPTAECLFYVTKRLCHGYNQLLQLDIAHRDVKLENTLFKIIPNANEFECEGVISDFGGACIISKLFEEHPYPSFRRVLGNGTKRNISQQIATQIYNKLGELRKFTQDSSEYKKLKSEITDLMIDNDFFSLGILFYRLWIGSDPPFASYRNGEYMTFDAGMTTKEKNAVLEQMELELASASQSLPQEHSRLIVDVTMDPLKEGLDVNK